MAKDRQGLHFTELVWESTEQNMEVPPRSSAEAVIPKPPEGPGKKKTSQYNTVQLQLWDMEETQEPVTTTESQFVQRARELADHKEPAALFVPFKSYWPTYGHMTGAQSHWYFFWRDEVRQGRYPKTDLSYIFLHIYELINGVGWDEPRDGCRQLGLLWEAYRDKYKRLDQYLGGWIADFSFVHKLDIALSEIVIRTRGLAGDLAELELVRCLSAAPEQLSIEVLSVMSDYDISKSKFYTGEGKAAAEKYIPQVVALIDTYVARKHGSNLITMFPPGPPVVRERYLFRSAVYDISLYGYSVLVPVVRISKSPPLRSLITRLFRLTENKLRALMGYRGRLKDVKVDADMEDLVTKFLQREFRKAEQEEKGPAVVIDQRKLEQLKNDSEVVRSLLTVEEALEKDDGTDWGIETLDEAEPGSVAVAAGSRSEETAGEGETAVRVSDEEKLDIIVEEPAVQGQADSPLPNIDGEADSWTSFASELSLLQRETLLALAEDEGLAKVKRLAAGGGTMAELLFDEINELAMDSLGDLVIDGEELTEECISMLHYIKR
ncbi:TerB N-terminal domain-containing protein [Paenibacillus sp. FSL R5-0912]|uniref:TerB N-terminal domain-containing protein n=1 Tax=Paenibacillus sp. FSL R5-0912 TaxID=1536771 RepID=UPI0006941CC3|nr:TerB N-terminal domain-containing protein [Paenibacillus sp. FSL R5-0912]